MNGLFLHLLNVSINAGWIVLGVMVLRALFRRAPKWIHCALWAVVAIRLILPFSFESPISAIPNAEPITQNSNGAIQIQTGITALDAPIESYLSSETNAPMKPKTEYGGFSDFLPLIWSSGVFCMISYGIFSYLVLKEKIDVSIKRSDGIYLCDGITTPFILGVFRPRIYLPSGLEKEHERFVIAHEKAHLKRLDHLWKPLAFVLLSIYWFQPLFWVAYVLLCRDIEAACDEKVISDYDSNEKKCYSETLLSCSTNRRWILACPVAFGEVAVKDRIKSVLNYKKPTLWIIIVALCIGAVFSVMFLTDPKNEKLYQKGEDRIDFVAIQSADYETKSYSDFAIQLVESFLDGVETERAPASRSRSEDRDKSHRILISYGIEKTVSYYFNENYNEVWVDDGVKPSYSFKVKDPVSVLRFFEANAKNDGLGFSEQPTVGESELDNAFTSEYLEMKEIYPDYFGLRAENGIEVYVWQLHYNSYSCAIMEGNQKNHKPEEMLKLPPIAMSTVHRILELQGIDVKDAVLIPITMPHSSYHYEITKEYVEKLETLFYPQTGNVMNVGSASERAFFDLDGDGSNEEVLISRGPELVAPTFLIAGFEVSETGTVYGYRPFDYYATFETNGPFKASFVTLEDGKIGLKLVNYSQDGKDEIASSLFNVSIDPLVPKSVVLTKIQGNAKLETHMKYGIDSAFSNIGTNENGEVNYVYSVPKQTN